MEFFDDYEVDREGASDLKRDQKYHARTSFESLKRFAQSMAATPECTTTKREVQSWMRDPYKRAPNKAQYWPVPNTRARRELDEMRGWLLMHSHELPSELEDEQGRIKEGRTYFEANDAGASADKACDFYDESDDVSKYEAHGRFHTLKNGHNEGRLEIALQSSDEEIRSNPLGHRAQMYAAKVRAERYQRFAEEQARRNRWRGMEEYDAVEKADEKLREGVDRVASDSKAKPLPSLERLTELFDVRDGVLYRKRLDRPVTGEQVKVDGKVYYSDRIIYALTNGEDPADRMVRDGVATKYRKAEGFVTPRGDGKYDARVTFGSDDVTIGEYKAEEQAGSACRLYLRSLEMGLL